MFFLGAGASVTSKVPPATLCIADWKKQIYSTENPSATEGSPVEIQKWLETQQGFPREASPEEYGFYVEHCYPDEGDRRQYFAELSGRADPSTGYRHLCLLAKAEILKAVWTTNFDSLVSRTAARENISVLDVTKDTTERVWRPFAPRGELLAVALHGDYRYTFLANTSAELQTLDEELRDALTHRTRDFSLVVVGYSGRDSSIMDTLKQAYSKRGFGRLYWCGLSTEPNDTVRDLLGAVRLAGRVGYYVPVLNFDDLLQRLCRNVLEGELLAASEKFSAQVPTPETAVDLESVRKKVDEFAEEYQRIRSSMKPGDERTRKMEDLVSTRIRTLGLSTYPLLHELTEAADPGHRLAAAIVLQQKPHPDYLQWLALRLGEEKPFVGYHAAVALSAAATALDRSYSSAVLKAVRDAILALSKQPGYRQDWDRAKVLRAAEQSLHG
jgi:hypothetical protein